MKTQKTSMTNSTTKRLPQDGNYVLCVETDGDGFVMEGQPENGYPTMLGAKRVASRYFYPGWAKRVTVTNCNGDTEYSPSEGKWTTDRVDCEGYSPRL